MERLLTPIEAAAYLRCTREHLWRMRQDGRGPFFMQEGRKVLYPESALQTWVKSRLTNKATEAA